MKEPILGTDQPLKSLIDDTGNSEMRRADFMKWEGKRGFNTSESKAKEHTALHYLLCSCHWQGLHQVWRKEIAPVPR